MLVCTSKGSVLLKILLRLFSMLCVFAPLKKLFLWLGFSQAWPCILRRMFLFLRGQQATHVHTCSTWLFWIIFALLTFSTSNRANLNSTSSGKWTFKFKHLLVADQDYLWSRNFLDPCWVQRPVLFSNGKVEVIFFDCSKLAVNQKFHFQLYLKFYPFQVQFQFTLLQEFLIRKSTCFDT